MLRIGMRLAWIGGVLGAVPSASAQQCSATGGTGTCSCTPSPPACTTNTGSGDCVESGPASSSLSCTVLGICTLDAGPNSTLYVGNHDVANVWAGAGSTVTCVGSSNCNTVQVGAGSQVNCLNGSNDCWVTCESSCLVYCAQAANTACTIACVDAGPILCPPPVFGGSVTVCGSASLCPDGGLVIPDAGPIPDAGSPRPDAGPATDAGSPLDGGPAADAAVGPGPDASTLMVDAGGMPADAGPGPDASLSSDGGPSVVADLGCGCQDASAGWVAVAGLAIVFATRRRPITAG